MATGNVTMTYAEFDRFWNEALGNDWYLDCSDEPDSFWNDDDPNRLGTFTMAEIGYQGSRPYPPPTTDWLTRTDLAAPLNFFTLVARWRANQKITTALVEVPKERMAEFREFVAGLKGRVLSPEEG